MRIDCFLALIGWVVLALSIRPEPALAGDASERSMTSPVRQAVQDLAATFGEGYPQGRTYLARLEALENAADQAGPGWRRALEELTREALLANPLLDGQRLMVVRRKPKDTRAPGFKSEHDRQIGFSGGPGRELGFPSNHECNSSLEREGYENEIALLSPVHPRGEWTTLYRPPAGGYAGEVDLHWDGDRLLFTQSDPESWKIWEVRTDGTGLRQVSRMPPDVDAFDACYLPNGRIVFGSTASYQAVPCWHGQKWVSNLYLMNSDGSGVRQLCFDQDHDFHPVVLENGQVLYHRWDYTGINHIFLRPLMVMNPDGTNQRAVYGSSSWYPNALYFPQPIPGRPGQLVSILSGYHGVHRMGQLVVIDSSRGWAGAQGLVQRISGRGDPIQPLVRDALVDGDWPKFLHPFPLNDKYFLVSAWVSPRSPWAIYLADVFDNLVLVKADPGWALLEPVLLRARPRPPILPDQVDLSRSDGVVYLSDVHGGPGLAGVPRGTIKRLRVLAYDFGYRGLAGPDKIGLGGPWEAMRILGTVPVEPDGSALFQAPAGTPLAVQPLDREGKAVQLMRSWFTLQPGEVLSCAGCHERPADAPAVRPSRAALQSPRPIEPWYGPARGFDFAREIQPVLNRYCVECHDGTEGRPDLRPEEAVAGYRGRRISDLGIRRLHPEMRQETGGVLRYTPAYEALLPYIRRVGIEDDVGLLTPGEYHADTSELVQMLAKGHEGVRLDAEAWDRLVTWIDLNGPCHGSWSEVHPVPDQARQRRAALGREYGGPRLDPELCPALSKSTDAVVRPSPKPAGTLVSLVGWPWSRQAAQARQLALQPRETTLSLGKGVTLKLVQIPAGEFLMGDLHGEPDEQPVERVVVREPFWMSAEEVSNEQFHQFDPGHDSGYYTKRHARSDDQGLWLNQPDQPVVRVPWDQAMAFCRWLTERTGRPFSLPTEAQWEYACRAGTGTALAYGDVQDNFSRWANMADQTFARGWDPDGRQVTGGLEHLVMEGAALSDTRYLDHASVTAPVGSYQPNPWGLYDMHGNAAEWTRTTYQPSPGSTRANLNAPPAAGEKVVRGGSFFDRPLRCRSAFRLAYPAWQRVFNVGFRVVCESPGQLQAARSPSTSE